MRAGFLPPIFPGCCCGGTGLSYTSISRNRSGCTYAVFYILVGWPLLEGGRAWHSVLLQLAHFVTSGDITQSQCTVRIDSLIL